MPDTIERRERIAQKSITYTGAAAGANTLFTVTGDVIVRIVAVVTTDLTSAAAANVSVGIAGATDAILPITVATTLDAREIWHDATPDSEIEALNTIREYIITDGNDIIITDTAITNTGTLLFYCVWTPLNGNGLVAAAQEV